MLTGTRKYSKLNTKNGFTLGSLAYRSIASTFARTTQQQVRVEAIVRSIAVCRVIMTRHQETVLGTATGVWCAWTPVRKTDIVKINVRDLDKKP